MGTEVDVHHGLTAAAVEVSLEPAAVEMRLVLADAEALLGMAAAGAHHCAGEVECRVVSVEGVRDEMVVGARRST